MNPNIDNHISCPASLNSQVTCNTKSKLSLLSGVWFGSGVPPEGHCCKYSSVEDYFNFTFGPYQSEYFQVFWYFELLWYTFGKLVKILPPPFGQTLIKLPPIGLTPIRLPPFENLYRFLMSAMSHSKRTFLELGRAICIQDFSQVSFQEILTRFVQGWNGKWNYLHFRQPLEVLWDALKKTFRFGGKLDSKHLSENFSDFWKIVRFLENCQISENFQIFRKLFMFSENFVKLLEFGKILIS